VTARDQCRHARTRVEQRADVRGRGLEVLEVVDDQERVRVAEGSHPRLERRGPARRAGAGGDGDRLGDEARVLQRGELDAQDAAAQIRPHRIGHGERHARLAHSSGPGHGDQARVAIGEHAGEAGELELAADELAGGHPPMVSRDRNEGNRRRAVSAPVECDCGSSHRRHRRR
jgi:hypothetical protein